MENIKKIKIYIGLFYIAIVGIFLYYLFSKFSLQELSSYEFIKDNIEYLSKIKTKNIFLLSMICLLFTILWVFPFLGFGSPVALLAGFILGKWTGTIITVIGLSIGATFLYIFANFFLKDFIRDKFLKKFQKLDTKFKQSEFIYLLIYRFIGGIPWQLSCILPTLFNVKVLNFFLATLLGIIPQIFLVVSIGSGLEKIIAQNLKPPRVIEVLSSPDIYFPLVAFFILIITTIFLRKMFYKK